MTSGVSFNHETITLDGEDYDGCEFRDCRLVYLGGEPPAFESCRFDNCTWKLDEAAQRTLGFLKVMWNAGGKAPVQALIKEVTGGGGK